MLKSFVDPFFRHGTILQDQVDFTIVHFFFGRRKLKNLMKVSGKQHFGQINFFFCIVLNNLYFF